MNLKVLNDTANDLGQLLQLEYGDADLPNPIPAAVAMHAETGGGRRG